MKNILTISSLVAIAVQAQATTLATETFTYPDGDLLGNGDWQYNFSGSNRPIQVSSGTITLVQEGRSGQDLVLPFPFQNTNLLTATFDFTVAAPNKVAGGDYEYFTHFTDASFSSLTNTGRLFILPAATLAGDFSFGISTRSLTAETTLAADLFFNTTYTATLSFDFSSGLASASVAGFGAITSTTPVSGLSLFSLGLRQSDSSSGERVTLDNLTIAAVPEPSSLALLGGSIGMFAFARRRSPKRPA